MAESERNLQVRLNANQSTMILRDFFSSPTNGFVLLDSLIPTMQYDPIRNCEILEVAKIFEGDDLVVCYRFLCDLTASYHFLKFLSLFNCKLPRYALESGQIPCKLNEVMFYECEHISRILEVILNSCELEKLVVINCFAEMPEHDLLNINHSAVSHLTELTVVATDKVYHSSSVLSNMQQFLLKTSAGDFNR